MFFELDARADMVRTVQATADSLDNSLGKQLQSGDT